MGATGTVVGLTTTAMGDLDGVETGATGVVVGPVGSVLPEHYTVLLSISS